MLLWHSDEYHVQVGRVVWSQQYVLKSETLIRINIRQRELSLHPAKHAARGCRIRGRECFPSFIERMGKGRGGGRRDKAVTHAQPSSFDAAQALALGCSGTL